MKRVLPRDLCIITDLEEEQVDSKSSVNALVGKSFFEQLFYRLFLLATSSLIFKI